MYRVIALSVGGLTKVFDIGDLVQETDFEEGAVPELIRDGFLKREKEFLPIDEKPKEEQVSKKRKGK